MRIAACTLVAILSTSASLITAPAFAAARSPVIVELFTAQGCVACPQADRLIDGLASRKAVVALTFPVDYWDYVGWKDTFAQPSFTERQRAYVNRMKLRELYTPEVVVQGRRESSGVDQDAVAKLVASSAASVHDGPSIRFLPRAARVEVDEGDPPLRGAEVWLARYDPTVHEVKVKAGENKGKTVTVRDVVRELVRLGSWSGEKRRYVLPKASEDGLSTVVLVQGAKGGPILSAAVDRT